MPIPCGKSPWYGGVGLRVVMTWLCLFLVVCTGFTTSFVTIFVGNEAVDDTRRVGEGGVAKAFASGEQNVESMAAEYMTSVVATVEAKVDNHFGLATRLTSDVRGFIQSLPKSVVRSSRFVEDTFLPMANSLSRHNAPLGITEFGLLHLSNIGGLHYTTVLEDPLTISNPRPNGFHHFIAVQTLNGTHYSEATLNSTGAVDRRAGCAPNGVLNETQIGYCVWDSRRIEQDGANPLVQAIHRSMGAPNRIMWSGIHGVLASVRSVALSSLTFGDGVLDAGDVYANASHPMNLAVVWTAVTTDGISRFVQGMPLPNGTRLYIAEINASNVTASVLAGANRGLSYTVSGAYNRRQPRLVAASTDPLIRTHFAERGEGVGNATGTEAGEWSHNATTYWETVTVLNDAHGLSLTVVLLVPKKVVLAVIMQSTKDVQHDIATEYGEVDERRENGFAIMLGTVVGTGVLLVCAGVYLSQRIVARPLEMVCREMADVADMKLEGIDAAAPLSRLTEVAVMQGSFRRMVACLIEYKSYLPQTVLEPMDTASEADNEKGDDASSVPTTHTSRTKNRSNQGDKQPTVPGSRRGSSSATDNTPAAAAAMVALREKVSMLSVQLHKRRDSAVAHVSAPGVAETTKVQDVRTMIERHTAWLDACVAEVREYRGVVDRFVADVVHVSFGTSSQTSQASVKAAAYALAVLARVKRVCGGTAPETYIGVSAGPTLSGTLGCANFRGPAVLGDCVKSARVMGQLARDVCAGVVVCARVNREVCGHFSLFPVEALMCGGVVVGCYQLRAAFKEGNDEWMYALQENEAQSSSRWLDAWKHVVTPTQDMTLALQMMKEYVMANPADTVAERIERAVAASVSSRTRDNLPAAYAREHVNDFQNAVMYMPDQVFSVTDAA